MLKVKTVREYKYGTTSMKSRRAKQEVKVFYTSKEHIEELSKKAFSDHEKHLKKIFGIHVI